MGSLWTGGEAKRKEGREGCASGVALRDTSDERASAAADERAEPGADGSTRRRPPAAGVLDRRLDDRESDIEETRFVAAPQLRGGVEVAEEDAGGEAIVEARLEALRCDRAC